MDILTFEARRDAERRRVYEKSRMGPDKAEHPCYPCVFLFWWGVIGPLGTWSAACKLGPAELTDGPCEARCADMAELRSRRWESIPNDK